MLSNPIIVAKCDGDGCAETLHVPFPKSNWGTACAQRLAEADWVVRDGHHYCSKACADGAKK